MAYSWTPEEGMRLANIQLKTSIKNHEIRCPKCGMTKFSMETSQGFGKCWFCDFKADVPAYVAAANNISVREAREMIENFYGYNKDDWKGKVREIEKPPVIEESPMAPPEVIDDTYRAFLGELILKDESRFEMKARCGIDDNSLEALGYRTYPLYGETDFFALCERLQRAGHQLEGVPGFFKAKKGEGSWMFPTFTQGILMPQVNYKNQITGLQLRKDDNKRVFIEEKGELESKCSWFSSKSAAHGTAAHAGVHYACDFKLNLDTGEYVPEFPQGGVVLTEGIMKADIVHYLMPNLPVLAVAGVNATLSLKEELTRVKGFGVDTCMLAYDMDYETNPHVQNSLIATKKIIEEAGLRYIASPWDTKIAEDDSVYLKGLDDYLAYAVKGIRPKLKESKEK